MGRPVESEQEDGVVLGPLERRPEALLLLGPLLGGALVPGELLFELLGPGGGLPFGGTGPAQRAPERHGHAEEAYGGEDEQKQEGS